MPVDKSISGSGASAIRCLAAVRSPPCRNGVISVSPIRLASQVEQPIDIDMLGEMRSERIECGFDICLV